MNIPLPTNLAVDMFSSPVTAFDIEGEYIDGEWVETQGSDYSVSATVTNPDKRDLQILSEGEISQGAIIIHLTQGELFYLDSKKANINKKQSYIRYINDIWRVKAENDRIRNGAYKRYVAVRSTEYDA